MIYFADALDGRIKIGTARNVSTRLAQLSAPLAKPLSLIGSIEGSRPLERAIHESLAEHSIGREWFRDCSEVRRAVRSLVLAGPKAIGFTGQISIPRPKRGARPSHRDRGPIRFRDLVTFASGAGFEEEYLMAVTGCNLAQVESWLNRESEPSMTAFCSILGNIFSRIGH